MAVLPDVLGCRPLRRTVQVRLGTNALRLPGGTPIFFALATLRSVPQAGSQFRGLATAIHETSELEVYHVIAANSQIFASFYHVKPSISYLITDTYIVRVPSQTCLLFVTEL